MEGELLSTVYAFGSATHGVVCSHEFATLSNRLQSDILKSYRALVSEYAQNIPTLADRDARKLRLIAFKADALPVVYRC